MSRSAVKFFVHGCTVTLATEELQTTPPSLRLRSARYDASQNAFFPLHDADLTLPLSENERLAAIGHVGCRTTGLFRTFLALATGESITIGRLDFRNSTFEPSGTIWLPQEDGGCESWVPDQCWLADGPTLVVGFQGKVVVASQRQEQRLPYHEFGCHSCASWNADMLEGTFERVFLAGDRVLCVSSVSVGLSSSASSRLRYVDLQSFPLLSDKQVGQFAPTLAKVSLPPDLDPCLITCVAYAPSGLGLPYNVVYGTSERRLLCCARDTLVKEIMLEESPFLLQFAVAARGAPVLVVSLFGMDRKVVAVCGISLAEIYVSTRVQQAVMADVARVGHDQLVLFIQPVSSTESFVESLQTSNLELGPETASDKHKSEILRSVTEALEMRFEAGLKELQAADRRRSEKMDMVAAACNLMQCISVQQDGIENMELPNDAIFVEAVRVQEVYQGRCFLIIEVHVNKHAPEGFHLRRPTLFLTSMHGHVDSFSCCLPSQLDSQRFLISFPLKACHLPLHMMFAAEMRIDKGMSSAWDPAGFGFGAQECGITKAPYIYTQWLHTIEDPVTTNLDLGVAPAMSDVKALCERWMTVMGGPVWKQHLGALISAISLQIQSGDQSWKVQGEGHDIEEDKTLSLMYAHDVSLVQKNVLSANFVHTLSSLHGPRLAEMVTRFAAVVLAELSCSKSERPGSKRSAEAQAVSDRCFCHVLSSLMHNSFGEF